MILMSPVLHQLLIVVIIIVVVCELVKHGYLAIQLHVDILIQVVAGHLFILCDLSRSVLLDDHWLHGRGALLLVKDSDVMLLILGVHWVTSGHFLFIEDIRVANSRLAFIFILLWDDKYLILQVGISRSEHNVLGKFCEAIRTNDTPFFLRRCLFFLARRRGVSLESLSPRPSLFRRAAICLACGKEALLWVAIVILLLFYMLLLLLKHVILAAAIVHSVWAAAATALVNLSVEEWLVRIYGELLVKAIIFLWVYVEFLRMRHINGAWIKVSLGLRGLRRLLFLKVLHFWRLF